jgi:putative DNA primase/helicase
MDARSLAAALNGDVVGQGRVLAPGPGHSPMDRSMSVQLDPNAPDGFLVNSFAGDDWRECRDHVRAALGLRRQSDKSRRTLARPQRTRITSVTASTTTASALALWNRASDAHGTVVEKYLAGRKLTLPDGDSVVRCVADIGPCGEQNAIMLAVMRNALTDEPVAIHRTFITERATKTHRKFLGPSRGAAVKLAAASDTLVVGEGLETAMAASCAGVNAALWAMGSSVGLAGLPVLPWVTKLVILAENDGGASRKAVSACHHTWSSAVGKRLFVVTPIADKDFADVWARAGADWRDYVTVERVR